MIDERVVWKGVGLASGLAVGLATRKVMIVGWERLRGESPPANPASPKTTWVEALAWATASGVALAIARLVAERGAAEAWKATTGSYPPGLEDLPA
jgi:hypothetical protein